MSYHPYANSAEWAEGNLDTLLAQMESQQDADEMSKIMAMMALSAQIDPTHPAYGSQSSYRALEAIERMSEEILSERNEQETTPSSGPTSTEYSAYCLSAINVAHDVCYGDNGKATRFKHPPDGSSTEDIAAALQRANLPRFIDGSNGNRVDLSNPNEVIVYVEDNIDAIVECFSDALRAEFLQVRDLHYQDPKHEDERRLRQLEAFFEDHELRLPWGVETCEELVAQLQQKHGDDFSWDVVWRYCDNEYGLNPRHCFFSWTDLGRESQEGGFASEALEAHEKYWASSNGWIERLSEDIVPGQQHEQEAAPATNAVRQSDEQEPPKAQKSSKSKSQRRNARRRQKQKKKQKEATDALRNISNETGVGTGKPAGATLDSKETGVAEPTKNGANKNKGRRRRGREKGRKTNSQPNEESPLQVQDGSLQQQLREYHLALHAERKSESNKGKGEKANSQPQPPATPTGQTQLTLAMLASETPEVQKNMIGGRLYPLIHKTHPKIAGKIADRLLELDNSSLLDLLESPEALEAKISEVERYSSGYWRHVVRSLKPVEKRRSYVSVVVP